MSERTKIGWQTWLAGLLFVAVLAVALLVSQPPVQSPPAQSPPALSPPDTPSDTAQGSPQPVAPLPGEATPGPVPALSEPPAIRPDLPLDRVGLLDLARAAASAHAAGTPLPDEVRALAGRRFQFRLPFGCAGPTGPGLAATSGWSYVAEKQTLRVFAGPADWSDAPWLRALDGMQAVERIEGFPVAYPWMLAPGCPPVRPAPAQPAAASPAAGAPGSAGAVLPGATPRQPAPPARPPAPAVAPLPELGLVQFFAADVPRSALRSERGYTAVVRRPPEAVAPDQSFLLVLGGRIASFPDGRTIACWGDDPARRPHCLIAVEVDSVEITDADGVRLASWEP